MSKTQVAGSKFDRFLTILVLSYQALAIVAFVLYPILASVFFSTPFIGIFIDNTMIANGIYPDPIPENWGLVSQGVKFGDQLQTLADQPVRSYQDMRGILTDFQPGDSIPAVFKSQNGEVKEYQAKLSTFSSADRLSYFYIPYIIGLVFLSISWWIFGLRRSETAGRAFIIFSASTAIASGALMNNYSTNRLLYLWSFAVPMVGAALVHLGLVFPQEPRLITRRPFLRLVGYPVAGLLAIISSIYLFNFDQPLTFVIMWRISYAAVGLAALFFFGMMVYRRFSAQSPVVRQQSGNILIGSIVAFAPLTAWFLLSAIKPQNFNPLLLLFTVAFPIVTGYTIMRSRVLRTDYLVSRGLLYVLMITLATGGYLVMMLGLNLLLGIYVAPNNPLAIGLMVAILVLLSNPFRTRLQQFVNSVFFRGQLAYQERLQAFSHRLTNAVALPDVLKIVREELTATLIPGRMHIYAYDPGSDQYAVAVDNTGRPTSDINFGRNSALVTKLKNEHFPLFFDLAHLNSELEPERTRLTLLGANLYVPLPGKDRLVGWVALGERLSGQSYTSADLAYIESICDQAAVAIERAQIILNMERRVQEMNVLSRVSQGVNITLRFDDILELIYAQATQVLPCNDFRLTLYNNTGQYAYYAFYLEDDERLSRMENKALAPKTSLSQEVILSRHSIVTSDYSRECQILGITSLSQGIYAWLGVPLNAGTETLGALSVGSRDPSVLYTPRQVELLQSIADQAAGAIVKARLLQETERRAVQLSTLNVLTRQLTSTLDLEPLLKNLLESAANILNCEAGTLFLMDEQTDDLVFRVTVGPVASNLVGQRLPAGSGVVGRVVMAREPVIVNEVQVSSQWNATPDQQTGFVTRAILAVPLEVKDHVIGVIELINKKDGLPFTEDDQNLLSAFAGQAAVAVDNARLYTLTDQELAARVEELSVMQRIDRELNASLEIERAMNITLEWAMRQSSAEAGFIGVMQEKGIRVMAQQGYEGIFDGDESHLIPLTHPAIIEALETSQPQRASLTSAETDNTFLVGTRSQLVLPIRRESKVIGLLLLESPHQDRFGEQALTFLNRLSDHAAIAIANAQLYNEVQAANIAKSQFVSFVAHELKNPMTSIKGYTELLAAGAVGAINEMQSNFLSTIRSNVVRIDTLVSDLNDNSKIEAGVLKLDYKALEVADLVDEVIRSTRRQIEDKQQTITPEFSSTLPKVWADRVRTVQVLVNLVSNANKYTQESGAIIVGAEESENTWDEKGATRVVHIWVKDNGIGLTPEDQKKIFQKFFRSEDDQARKSPGTGLGLNITRSLVELQGGRIWFESEFRKGTIFHFTIPVSEN
jgi:signal transduction histidine kinase